MTAREQTGTDPLPETPDAEIYLQVEGEVGEAALEMYKAGLIDWSQVALLIQWTNPTDTAEYAKALAAGEFRISKQQMTDRGISTAGVTEEMKGHSEWFKSALGYTGNFLKNVATLYSPAVAAGRVGWWAKDWVVDAYGEDIAGRDEINAAIEDVRNLPESVMSESQKEDLIQELGGVPGGLGVWMPGGAGERITQVLTPYAELFESEIQEKILGEVIAPTTGEMTPKEARAYKMEHGGPAVGAFGGIQRQPEQAPAPPTAAPGTFAAYLQEDNLIGIDDPLRLPIDLAAPVTGLTSLIPYDVPGEAFYDKSTNAPLYSDEEYQRILKGREMVALGYTPDAGTYERADGTIGGGGAMGAAFAESQLGPNMNDPDVRRAVETSRHVLPEYYGVQAKVASLFPDQPWEREAYAWRPGSAIQFLNGLSAGEKRAWKNSLQERGLFNITDEQGRTYFDSSNQDWYLGKLTEDVLGVSRGEQISPWKAIPVLGAFKESVDTQARALLAHMDRLSAAAAPVKQPFEVPASMRSVPHPKEIAQDVTDRFRARVGRDPTEVERDNLAGELSGYHQDRNRQMIDLAYAEWEGSSEIMDGGDLEEIMVNPSMASTFDMEKEWANEIRLGKQREVNSDSFGRMANAAGFGSYGTTITSGNNVVGR